MTDVEGVGVTYTRSPAPRRCGARRPRPRTSRSVVISVGAAGCRHELDALREGLGVFESTLERPAPPELHDRVLGVLTEEWAETGTARGSASPSRPGWRVVVAAALVAALSAGAFGLVQYGRTRDLLPDARGYRAVLATLGGTGFKVGTLQPARPGQPVEGSVVAYESSHDQSFVVVFVRTPELEGLGSLKVSRADGTTWDPAPDRVRRGRRRGRVVGHRPEHQLDDRADDPGAGRLDAGDRRAPARLVAADHQPAHVPLPGTEPGTCTRSRP